jgi:hypothetical protein
VPEVECHRVNERLSPNGADRVYSLIRILIRFRAPNNSPGKYCFAAYFQTRRRFNYLRRFYGCYMTVGESDVLRLLMAG